MLSLKTIIYFLTVLTIFILPCGCERSEETEPMDENDETEEEEFIPFLGKSFFRLRTIFSEGKQVRESYLAVAVVGTILALRNRTNPPYTSASHLRRSEDGGQTWSEIIEVPFGWLDSNFIIDTNRGDILVVRMWYDIDRLWRSSDHGKTWSEEKITLKLNEVIKWSEMIGLKERVAWSERGGGYGTSGKYTMHENASESGITLKYGKNPNRLIISATYRPHAPEHPSDRDSIDAIYSTAIYSDDGGSTWQVSGLFPEGYTEEAALVELHDGRIYYNSPSHKGLPDKSANHKSLPDEMLRREAWSYDNGQTWEDMRVNWRSGRHIYIAK